ncbi:kinase-like domain-containing protein [Mycena galericulata]|nr:kinase-like domain-containing protein [Mycena galericulata]
MPDPLLPQYPHEWPALHTAEDVFRFVTKRVPSSQRHCEGATVWLTSSSSRLYRTVLKRPMVESLEVEGRTLTNVFDVGTSFARELRFFRNVAPHPNIVEFFGCIDGVGLVIEAIDGKDLSVLIQQENPPPTELKIVWANQLIHALVHIHACGLSHGDISPGNTLVDSTGKIRLIDFGRSACAGEELFPATHPFTAPDNRESSEDPTLSDAYALGVLLVCLERNAILKERPTSQGIDHEVLPIFGHLVAGYMKDRDRRAKVRIEDMLQV